MFGVGAAILVTTSAWQPSATEAFLDTLFAIGVLLIFALWFLPRRLRKLHRDNEVAYWWDTHLQRLLGNERLPPDLQPGPTWPSAVASGSAQPAAATGAPLSPAVETASAAEAVPAAEAARPAPPAPAAQSRWRLACQIVHNVEFAITVAFALLFVGCAWGRWCHVACARPAPGTPSVTFHGAKYHFEGDSLNNEAETPPQPAPKE